MSYAKHLVKNLFDKNIEQVPTRNGFGDALIELGAKNNNVVVLTGDLAESTRSLGFAQKYPNRFIEVGVAEQNMMGIAAGLALSGKIPFISSYAVFNPGRNWDQLRVSVCYSEANVKIAGAHSGISVGPDGATHQALEDIAITRVLPNLTVIVPADYHETKKATLAAAELKGPVYLRFAREKTPVFTTKNSPFKIGKAEILKEGKDVAVIGAGPVLYEALLAAKQLESKISVMVVDSHTVKPIDKNTIVNAAKKTGAIVTIEEHQVNAGVGGAIAEVVVENYPVPMKRVAVLDHFGESGEPPELIEKFGLSSKSVIKAIQEVMKRKKR